MQESVSSGQKRLEAYVDRTLKENNMEQKDSINGMMQARKVNCSFEEKSVTFGFPVRRWQVNRVGQLHGGMICTAFDFTIAFLARFYAGKNFTPTVSLDVKYIRPVEVGDVMLVKAKVTSAGRRITQLVCEAVSQNTGKLVATGAYVYMNVDTVEERQI